MRKVARPNKYAGNCTRCGTLVPAERGFIQRVGGEWVVQHHVLRAHYPTGPWDKWEPYATGGCPGEAEAENAAMQAKRSAAVVS